jgi:type I restriction enzyme S subunit
LEPDPKGVLVRKVDTGSTPSTRREDFWGGNIPWLTPKEITGLTDGLFVSRTERQITKAGLTSCSARLLPAGTIMLTKRAPVGTVAVNAVPMATNQGFLNFQCGPAIRPLYLAYWFRANKPYLNSVANGSTYPELYRGDLFEFEIAIPDLDIQDKIIEVLSALQFVALMGLPLEQSVTSPEEMLAIQNQTRRLAAIRDQMLPLLLSGKLNVSSISTTFLRKIS